MTHAAELSMLVQIATAILVVLGAALTFVGSLGLVRLKSFYDRMHAPTLGTTLGAGLILAASMLLFSATAGRPVLHEIVIALMVIITTPVTILLLVRAALYRDQAEGRNPIDEP